MSDYRKILATTDFSDRAGAGVAEAAALARRLGSRLLLLYVVEDDLPPILVGVSEERRREILAEHAERAEAALAEQAAPLAADLAVEVRTRVGVPSREIVRCAEEEGADLLVVASRGYGPLGQVFLGSTAERVLHHASCPVLVVRAAE